MIPALCGALTLISAPVFGWGDHGHTLVNEAATFAVPSEMPVFFHRAYPRLVYLGFEPDRWRRGGESLDSVSAPDHVLDLEIVQELELPERRHDYIDLLVESGTLERRGLGVSAPGFAPWRIAELCDLLELQWRTWRRTDLLPHERAQIEETIIFHSGILGHYVADAANPHHATIHYNGWLGVPNSEAFATDCSTHFRFETGFVSRAMTVEDVVAKLSSPARRRTYFPAALELLRESNAEVRTLYRIDRDGGFGPRLGTPEAREFTAGRLAAGASLLRDLWWSAWVRSGEHRR